MLSWQLTLQDLLKGNECDSSLLLGRFCPFCWVRVEEPDEVFASSFCVLTVNQHDVDGDFLMIWSILLKCTGWCKGLGYGWVYFLLDSLISESFSLLFSFSIVGVCFSEGLAWWLFQTQRAHVANRLDGGALFQPPSCQSAWDSAQVPGDLFPTGKPIQRPGLRSKMRLRWQAL